MVDLVLNPEAQDAYWAAAVLRCEVGFALPIIIAAKLKAS